MRQFNLGHSEILRWPMDKRQLDSLGRTLLHSPRIGNAHGYKPPSDEQYVAEVEELREVRRLVESNRWPGEYLEKYMGVGSLSPLLKAYLGLSEQNPKGCADTVRMDHPFDIWDLVVRPYARDNSIGIRKTPVHRGVPFTELILVDAEAHRIIAKGLNKAFDVKYEFGVCRPIEYFDPNLQRYATPNHPCTPAGHGAFAGAASRAFELLRSPDPAQVAAVQVATKQFAMFRSFSAMHIPYSNLLGWQIGHEVE